MTGIIQDGAKQLPPVAVFACHGMGQQVAFETIDSVVHALADQEQIATRGPRPFATPKLIGWEGEWLARATIVLTTRNGDQQPVHLYEAYWAPLTEGKIGLWATLGFLLGASFRGITFSVRGTFDRWMFGHQRHFGIPPRAAGQLLLAGIVVVCLCLVYIALSTDVVLATLLAVRAPWPDWPHVAVPIGWTTVLAVATISVAGVGWILSLFLQWRRRTERPSIDDAPPPWSVARVVELVTALGLAVALMVGVGWLTIKWGRLLNHYFIAHETWAVLCGAVVAVVFLALRWFLIEYVGDVAIYTCAYKVSRFSDIRRQIQDVGRRVGRLVYATEPPGAGVKRYERIFVLGHSLGSVIAYDVLNDMVNGGLVPGAGDTPHTPSDAADVAGRTKLLLTFGSPLDKTAFIFRVQQQRTDVDVRETLASATQPLILDTHWRPANWSNIWSPWDWISGSLGFYDPPPGAPDRGVRNLQEHLPFLARNPVCAHAGYWRRALFGRLLYAALTGADEDLAGIATFK
jgi:hypothetical protein